MTTLPPPFLKHFKWTWDGAGVWRSEDSLRGSFPSTYESWTSAQVIGLGSQPLCLWPPHQSLCLISSGFKIKAVGVPAFLSDICGFSDCLLWENPTLVFLIRKSAGANPGSSGLVSVHSQLWRVPTAASLPSLDNCHHLIFHLRIA